MPIYEYVCRSCGKEFEQLVSSSRAEPSPCPSCGAKGLDKKFSSFAVGSAGSSSPAREPACGQCASAGRCPFGGN